MLSQVHLLVKGLLCCTVLGTRDTAVTKSRLCSLESLCLQGETDDTTTDKPEHSSTSEWGWCHRGNEALKGDGKVRASMQQMQDQGRVTDP